MVVDKSIISYCDNCNNEDSINIQTGLCPSCEKLSNEKHYCERCGFDEGIKGSCDCVNIECVKCGETFNSNLEGSTDKPELCDSCWCLEEKNHFVDDEEKIDDFLILEKEHFLQSYSYLTEKEYENTRNELRKRGYKYKLYDGQGGEFMMTRKYKNKNEIRADFFEFARHDDMFEDSDMRTITLNECLEIWTMELKEI